ncbi:MAG: nuclear transport factor 2 family protein, partial [Pyrinomonadaceae bacterium]
MKKMLMVMVIALAASSIAFGQTKMSKDKGNSVETQIIALEKQGWEAWKNKNSSWFQANLTEDALFVSSDGVANKSHIIKFMGSECEIKSYLLDNFKFLKLDKNSAVITFTGTQDGMCSGKTLPATVHGSAIYVKRGGKWLVAFYTDTPA